MVYAATRLLLEKNGRHATPGNLQAPWAAFPCGLNLGASAHLNGLPPPSDDRPTQTQTVEEGRPIPPQGLANTSPDNTLRFLREQWPPGLAQRAQSSTISKKDTPAVPRCFLGLPDVAGAWAPTLDRAPCLLCFAES